MRAIPQTPDMNVSTALTINAQPFRQRQMARRAQGGIPIGSAALTVFLVFLLPLCLALYLNFMQVTVLSPTMKVGFLVFLLFGSARILSSLGKLHVRSPSLWAALLFLFLFVTSAYNAVARPGPAGNEQIRMLMSAALWISPIWLIPAYLKNHESFAFFVKALRVAGLLMGVGAPLAYVAHKAGFDFGEVIEGRGSELRVFGVLGDNEPFALMLFFLWAFVESKWLLVAFYGISLGLAATRGLLLAGGVAVGFYFCSMLFASSGQRTIEKRLARLGAYMLAIMFFGALYLATPSGQYFLSRFGTVDELVYENQLGGRTINIEFAWDLFMNRPFSGYGFYGYAIEAAQFAPPSAEMDPAEYRAKANGLVVNATNQLMQCATDGGAGALLLFLALGASVTSLAWRLMKGPRPNGFIIAVSAYSVGMLVGLQSAVYIIESSISCAYIGMAVGLLEAYRNLLANRASKSSTVPPRSRVDRQPSPS